MGKKKTTSRTSALLEEAIFHALLTGEPQAPPVKLRDRDEVDIEAEHAWQVLSGAWMAYHNPDVEENIKKHCTKIIRRMSKAAHFHTPGRPASGDDPVEWEPWVKELAPIVRDAYKEYYRKKFPETSLEEIRASFAKILDRTLRVMIPELGRDFEERVKNVKWVYRRIEGIERDLLAAITGLSPEAVTKTLQRERKKKRSK